MKTAAADRDWNDGGSAATEAVEGKEGSHPAQGLETTVDLVCGRVDLIVAFRTMDDGRLHLAQEPDVTELPAFSLLFTSAQRPSRQVESTEFVERELTFYYRPRVPMAVVELGRSAGYTLDCPEEGLIACVSGPVFDVLFCDPRRAR